MEDLNSLIDKLDPKKKECIRLANKAIDEALEQAFRDKWYDDLFEVMIKKDEKESK